MKILAIDPGTSESAYIYYCTKAKTLYEFDIVENKNLLKVIERLKKTPEMYMAIEMIKSYGNIMGDSTIQTCVWIGRFIEAWGEEYTPIPRKTIVTNLCRNPRAKDSNVRQALIDLFGGPVEIKKGGKLYGVSKDVWSALALAVVWAEIKELERVLK